MIKIDKSTRIMVTGGTSMIGREVVARLKGFCEIDICPHDYVDFTFETSAGKRIDQFRPDYIISLAGYNGGIKFNKEKPADIYYKNSMMALNILNAARIYEVKKVVYVIPSCSYPNIPFSKESDYWNGPCHESVECHGLSKSHFFEYSRQLYKQYKLMSVGCCLNTCFGPHDKFNENAKVIGSMIKKVVDAHLSQSDLEVWGTGSPKRAFIYVEDAARAILEVLHNYDNPMELINIQSEEISIRELVMLIVKIIGFKGDIIFDENKPDGQMRKMLDYSKSRDILLFEPATSLRVGLQKTIQWYMENR